MENTAWDSKLQGSVFRTVAKLDQFEVVGSHTVHPLLVYIYIYILEDISWWPVNVMEKVKSLTTEQTLVFGRHK